MAYGQYFNSRSRNISGPGGHLNDDENSPPPACHQTPAPATINWKSLLESSSRTGRRLGRAKTDLVPQRIAKLETEENSSTLTGGRSGSGSTSSPKLRHRKTTHIEGAPFWPIKQMRSASLGAKSRDDVDNILGKYASVNRQHDKAAGSKLKSASSTSSLRKQQTNEAQGDELAREFYRLYSKGESSPPRNSRTNVPPKTLSPLAEDVVTPSKLNTSFMEDSSSVSAVPEVKATPSAIFKTADAVRETKDRGNRTWIDGKCYSIVHMIGSGGSARVFRALDEDNQLVAIKRVNITDVSDVEAQGFRNEIELLHRLRDNRRIVTLYGSEEREEESGTKRVLYMVMEHGEKDLSKLLKEIIASRMKANGENVRVGLTDAKTKFYWEEMLEVVQEVHRQGIIHSDLKPANFVIVGGFLKLIDFGIASAVADDKTHVTKDNLIGTFNFMSPEAIQDQGSGSEDGVSIKINCKSDVWSLGCILYNLIYGKMPFGEIQNPMKKFQAIVDPAHKIRFGPVPGTHDPQVVDVLSRCLARDPHERASIEQLLSHPYLKATSNATPRPENHRKSVAEVLSVLSSLTPNTKSSVVKKLTGTN